MTKILQRRALDGLILRNADGTLMGECCCYEDCLDSVCIDIDLEQCDCITDLDFPDHEPTGTPFWSAQWHSPPTDLEWGPDPGSGPHVDGPVTLDLSDEDATYCYYGSRCIGNTGSPGDPGTYVGRGVIKYWTNRLCSGTPVQTLSYYFYGHVLLLKATRRVSQVCISSALYAPSTGRCAVEWHSDKSLGPWDFGDAVTGYACTAYAADTTFTSQLLPSVCDASTYIGLYSWMTGSVSVTSGDCPEQQARASIPRLSLDDSILYAKSAAPSPKWDAFLAHADSVTKMIALHKDRQGSCWERRQRRNLVNMCKRLRNQELRNGGEMIA